MHLGQWFVRGIIFQIPQISPIVASFWTPKVASLDLHAPFGWILSLQLNFTNHVYRMLLMKFLYIWIIGSLELEL